MTTKAAKAWNELNERQQKYLETLYDVDQGLEAERRSEAARGRWSNTPARVWRRIDFNNRYSPVVSRLRALGIYDAGAGATLAALRTRGLIETETAIDLRSHELRESVSSGVPGSEENRGAGGRR